MKSRVTTYLLIAATLAVWGVVAWRIFSSRPDRIDAPIHRDARSEPHTGDESLLLDYKDPFLRNTTAAAIPKPAIKQPPKAKPADTKKPVLPKEIPPIKYTGTIKAGGRISYLFEYSGLQHALAPGDEFEGYTLAEAFPDSVRFSKNGDFFTLPLQK